MGSTVTNGRHRVLPESSATATATHGSFRSDLQGLRAIAVGLVVVYHLNSSWLTGGYVGVDVFFAISGYLITGNLVRAFRRRGQVDLLGFYASRARRLLPAAALVLTVTWLASERILPKAQLADTASQIRASALYFQNWTLSHNAVDYLKSSDAPTPVQHFWSLSVEEQFYLVWPLLFIVAALLVRRTSHRFAVGTIVVLAAAIVVASLRYSLHLTSTNPSAAYFVTTTRIWELGLGGLLALAPGIVASAVRRLWWLSWLGLALIAGSALLMTDSTPFPGRAAVVPVVGAVLMLGCGAHPRGTGILTSLRPMVFLGDISYSLYLWHWPLIVLFTAYTGHGIGLQWGVVLGVTSVVLAWLTKVFVEDPVRRARVLTAHNWRSLAIVLLAVIPVALVSVFLLRQPGQSQSSLSAKDPGADVLATLRAAPTTKPVVPADDPVPDPAVATKDYAVASTPKCLTAPESSAVQVCTFGVTENPRVTVALVGDSVIAQWSSALDEMAKKYRWKLVVEVHSGCPWTKTMTTRGATPYTACYDWGVHVMADMTKLKPDVLLTSDRTTQGTPDHHTVGPAARKEIGDGMVAYWNQLTKLGTSIVAIKESPEMHKDIPDCLTSRTGSVDTCSTPAKKAVLAQTPITFAAAAAGKSATLIDMNPLICGDNRCRPIVGNVVVYRDKHHLTASYTMTLEPYLEKKLLAVPALAA